MVIRLPLAFILGLAIYMTAMAMTVYDGALSMIFQPIMGSILTTLALAALCAVGSPLLLQSVWRRWRQIGWFALVLTIIGIAACVASWLPPLRIKVLNPETKTMVDSFQPVLSIGGWLLAMFGIAFCPTIGFRGDRRWV